MEVDRIDGGLRVLRRQGYGFGISFFFIAGFVLFVGFLATTTGQHFPHMSSLETGLWALVVGMFSALLGAIFTGTKDQYFFSFDGLQANFSRWRFIRWEIHYSLVQLQSVHVEPQPGGRGYRVMLEIKERPPIPIAQHLISEEAWQLASMIAEPTQLAVH